MISRWISSSQETPASLPIFRWAPGFKRNTKILSYGVYGEYDRRNDDQGLTKGFYLYGRFASADGLNYDNNPVFQDYGWLETEFDARGYVPLFSDRTSLAVRAYSDLKSPKGGSQIPFYDLAIVGGQLPMCADSRTTGSAAITACSFWGNCARRCGGKPGFRASTSSGLAMSDRYGGTTVQRLTLPSSRTMTLIPGIGVRVREVASNTGYRRASPLASNSDIAIERNIILLLVHSWLLVPNHKGQGFEALQKIGPPHLECAHLLSMECGDLCRRFWVSYYSDEEESGV